MVGPITDTRCKRMSSTFKFFDSHVNSQRISFWSQPFEFIILYIFQESNYFCQVYSNVNLGYPF